MGLSDNFYRLKRLPPYVFAQVQSLKLEARHQGEDIIDFGMGNPDQPTPNHIVEKMIEAARKGRNHRYSASRGITKLRHAITAWYRRNYDVDLDPETEAIVTIGSKEGLAHLSLAMIGPGDVVLTPTPTYPIHMYSFVIAGGEVRGIELRQDSDFFDDRHCRSGVLQKNRCLRQGTPCHRDPRPGLCRLGVRWLSSTELSPGAGGERHWRGVLYVIQGLQYAGLAGRFLRRQPRGGGSVGQDQKLPRLRHLSTAADRQRHRAQRSSGLRQGNGPALSKAPRRARGRAQSYRVERQQTSGHDVRVGQNSIALSAYGVSRVFQTAVARCQSCRLTWYRLW